MAEGDINLIPIIYFVAVIKDGRMYWRDDRLYRTEDGARKRKEKILYTQYEHLEHLTILYADDFKQI